MTVWLDAQISPAMAVWLRMRFDLDAHAVRDLRLRDAEDPEIFGSRSRFAPSALCWQPYTQKGRPVQGGLLLFSK